ncbi:cutinase family protein [Gordonia sp. SL306]|uniref:cutinase family protein n=1 Tax=Gordonia sp. SL306 TaxID=2995145 RepID=UPI002271FBB5|nr:cutinase family protein [Gordonia sp. SL306]WAC58085.1 cutinase family protein [Gordonia sp. SL306]
MFASVVAVMTAAGISVGVGSPAVAAPPGCPAIYVLAVPGTWANGQSPGMLREVTSGLGPETRVQFVGYDATAFPWEKAIYGKSKAQAVANTTGLAAAMLRRCPGTRIALTGYSQGADAAGDVASEIGTGRAAIRPGQVAGVVLISDPRRSRQDNLIGPPLTGEGSGGPRLDGMGWVKPRAFTICEPLDLYCNVPRDYFITRIVGYLAETSDPTPSQIGQYQAEAGAIVAELLTLGGPGKIVGELSNARAREQITIFNAFLKSGTHGNYAAFQVRPGVTAVQWAHDFLARLA